MNSVILIILLYHAFFATTYAASHKKIINEDDRMITLNKVIKTGKSRHVETNRHMHLSWNKFRQVKENEYESRFDELICTDPDRLRETHTKMDVLTQEVELGWELKQEQLKDLLDILHHENYTNSGLSTGNTGVDNLCQGLQEYIEKVNGTAWKVEKPELEDHLQEVVDIKMDIETHPCPCLWSSWETWSVCSTTCEAGSRYRQREIEKEAINNGTECMGDGEDREGCNEDVCCPINCVWSTWDEWNACPSGCNQKTIRTRSKDVVAECSGIECQGEDYEEMQCSRERELEDKIIELEQELDTCLENPISTTPVSTTTEYIINYTKFINRECDADKYGSYETLEEAKDACSADKHCKGVYDDDCNGNQFYLCPGPSFYNWHRHSCIINKANRSDWHG